jgi:hypothetical protein
MSVAGKKSDVAASGAAGGVVAVEPFWLEGAVRVPRGSSKVEVS